ncbi:ATP-binding protein [Sphingobium bisphenolivorans]|uniref:ATP-binding protein n=1 Tax=Sphingobium bisphenolivorans TaxID=1335760 RepID=UPI00039A559B|nr:HAMP domain-containing sensor histidine kinase [Sphingobium bisphenolivorans]
MRHTGDAKGSLSNQDPAREIIHDLRNLFAVIASIQHLLTKNIDGRERENLLRGLEEAAGRGGELASRLLSKEAQGERHLLDVGTQVAEAAPMLQAIVRSPASLEIDTQVAVPAALVSADPAELEGVMLELVANATAAGARRVMLRCRRIGNWIWLIIADDGPGLLQNGITKWPNAAQGSGHGIGLGRVRRAVRDMGGKLLVRGSAGAGVGTAVALLLPVALHALSKPRAREWRASHLHKESCDENRRTVAA